MLGKLRFPHFPAVLAALTGLGSLLTLAGTTVWQRWLPAALWHVVFAVGALPLILAAMIYFTPVLTRTPEPPRALAVLPLTALLAGLGIVGWFAYGVESLRIIAPWLALLSLGGVAYWMRRRQRACLGPPHACLAWYASAMFCLALGLVAVGASYIHTEWALPLRAFHLHINTLGFMGMTAIGTLQVLLPTVLGHPDPAAPRRLARDLPWSLTGALGIAAGAALDGIPGRALAVAATVAYAWPLLQLVKDLRQAFGDRMWARGQPAPLLLAAIAGLGLTLLHGVAHDAGGGRARDALPLFLIAFLLPLVSGAVTQLLPVWLRPGAQADWHKSQRSRLASFARTRAVLLLAGGLLTAAGAESGYFLGIVGALWLTTAILRVAAREFWQPR